MKCAMTTPGNVGCPSEALYEITSPGPKGTRYRRYVCLGHLAAAIDLDMRLVSGVRVRMAEFGPITEERARAVDDGG